MTQHNLTKNGKVVATATVYPDAIVVRLFGRCEGMVARFRAISEAKMWAERELMA